MKKIHCFFLILCFFLYPTFIFGAGQEEKKIIVPGEAVMAAYINIEETLNTPVTSSILDSIFMIGHQKPMGKSSIELLDEQLMRGIGITSKDLKEITFFSLSFDMQENDAPAGIHLVCTEDAVKNINLYLKNNYAPTQVKYKNTQYMEIKNKNRSVSIHTKGSNLFMAADPKVMEKMLDAAYGKGSLRDNKKLYSLITAQKTNPFYVTGYIPDRIKTSLPYPFELMKDFALNFRMETTLSISCAIQTENPKTAEEFLTSIKGMIALSGMAVLAQNKSAYPILQALIKKISYEQKGATARISLELSKQDLKSISELAPVLLQLMR